MTCVGMDGQMRQAVQDIVKVPVILASSLLGRLVAEMVASRPARPFPETSGPGGSRRQERIYPLVALSLPLF